MQQLSWTEGEWNELPPHLQPGLRRAVDRAQRVLRPRFQPLSEAQGRFRIDGLIGSLQLEPGTTLRLEPKTVPEEDWVAAVLHLMLPKDRADTIEFRAAPEYRRRRDPLDALASLYLSRLERALRRDGPLLVLRQTHNEAQRLRGRLRISEWARHAAWKPHVLPYEHHTLTADNLFTRTLAFVASLLARASTSLQTKAALTETARLLRPGYPDITAPPTLPNGLDVPQQWAIYRPAWEIARAVLDSRSLLGATGARDGLTLVIEAWPLLEHLLDRVLSRVATLAADVGREVASVPQRETPLLGEPRGTAVATRSAKPDGTLLENGKAVAVFDAKYSRRRNGAEWPVRDHVFQVLTSAAVAGAQTAVLVYPERFPIAEWKVHMQGAAPTRLVCLGLDMFGVTSVQQEEQRAQTVASLLGLNVASLQMGAAFSALEV